MSQTDYKKMSESEKKKEDWMNAKWRPMMGWIYMVTCSCDFILFPVLWSILQSVTGASVTQWNPITLQGAGLYHLAMGAVLGVAAWSRGQEKLAGVAGGSAMSGMGMGNTGMGMNNMGMGGMGMNTSMNNSYNTQPAYRPASSPPPTAGQPVRTTPPRELTEKSKRILPDNDMDDADTRAKADPEARG